MYSLVANRDIAKTARDQLYRALRSGARVEVRPLSSPGGSFDAKVLTRRDLGIWAYINDKVEDGRYYCWFGVTPTDRPWQPEIEINIPVHHTLHCYGQLVCDEAGAVYIAHRGGLGGGKFSVTIDAFADLINGFDPDDVTVAGKDLPYKFYILGRANDKKLLRRLADYVREASRIRNLRRNKNTYSKNLAAVQTGLTHENEGEGSYSRPASQVTYTRFHGKIHRALTTALSNRKLKCSNRRRGNIGPDLYISREKNPMVMLFEIKVGHDTHSIFSAMGQLLVYSSEIAPQPKRVLVTRGLPKNTLFLTALKKNRIDVLYYRVSSKRIEFPDIDILLKRNRIVMNAR